MFNGLPNLFKNINVFLIFSYAEVNKMNVEIIRLIRNTNCVDIVVKSDGLRHEC